MITQPTIYLMWTGVIFQKITIFLCCFQSEWFWLNIKLSTAMNDIHPFKSNWSINNFQWYTSTLVFFFRWWRVIIRNGVHVHALCGQDFFFFFVRVSLSFLFLPDARPSRKWSIGSSIGGSISWWRRQVQIHSESFAPQHENINMKRVDRWKRFLLPEPSMGCFLFCVLTFALFS